MSRGILDDIIMQVNSMKQAPLQWMQAQPSVQQQVTQPLAQQTVQSFAPQAHQRSYQQNVQQMHTERHPVPDAPQYFNYSEAIQQLYQMLLSLPVSDLEAAFSQLMAVTEAISK